MPYHHIAIATRDMQATHKFYSEAMGFKLVRAEKAQTGTEAWAKHFFYDTGDGSMMAFWELHDENIDPEFPTAIADGLGLPRWTNHLAFALSDLEALDNARKRLNLAGHDVTEMDHHWCKSIYANDPNDIMVEFCVSTRTFDGEDERRALAAVGGVALGDEPPPVIQLYKAGSPSN